MNISIQRGYQPGCIGRIAELHAQAYTEIAGFGVEFEAKVARELGEFCSAYDTNRDGLWLLKCDGITEGSIAIDGTHATTEGAHLRWFIISQRLRGQGAGNQLLDHALTFCRDRRHSKVFLWTFERLDAARHLYEKFGFRLRHQQRGMQWGTEVNEQRFELNTISPL